jgi:hypothetical protein
MKQSKYDRWLPLSGDYETERVEIFDVQEKPTGETVTDEASGKLVPEMKKVKVSAGHITLMVPAKYIKTTLPTVADLMELAEAVIGVDDENGETAETVFSRVVYDHLRSQIRAAGKASLCDTTAPDVAMKRLKKDGALADTEVAAYNALQKQIAALLSSARDRIQGQE